MIVRHSTTRGVVISVLVVFHTQQEAVNIIWSWFKSFECFHGIDDKKRVFDVNSRVTALREQNILDLAKVQQGGCKNHEAKFELSVWNGNFVNHHCE